MKMPALRMENAEVLPAPPNPLYPKLVFKKNHPVTADELIDLYDSSGLNRPTKDRTRMQEMLDNSNLLVSAWDDGRLVGVARSLTDWAFCCYVSDLAVRKEYQKGGLGKRLIMLSKEVVGPRPDFFLMAAPTAMEYYPKIGMQKMENGFIIHRTEGW
ncbi:hypothetical protein RvY_16239 [Ramazzottius varieornatus]|uniref:N-acetyltransferase domain-containing protein n=1 Tax=Ramazzottius varieornatus TaxID=947166 RepID=A0A1D1VXR3_RAMVA|nr:hypothetical protein RvY_16239 [Ramazzottius varieornatus]